MTGKNYPFPYWPTVSMITWIHNLSKRSWLKLFGVSFLTMRFSGNQKLFPISDSTNKVLFYSMYLKEDLPVRILWKAVSTLVESRAEVSINDKPFLSTIKTKLSIIFVVKWANGWCFWLLRIDFLCQEPRAEPRDLASPGFMESIIT